MARRAEDFLDAESFLDAGSTSQIAAPSSRQSAESFLDAEAFLDAAPASSPGRARMASSQFARGFGAVATSIPKYAAIASQGNREALLEAFDAIDSDASKGAPRDVSVFDQPLLIQYRRASPEERAQLRSDAEDRVSDPRGTSLYRSGQAAQQAIEAWFPTNPEYAEEWLASKIPQGLGSATGFLSLGLLGRLAGASAGATAATGGAALGGTDQFESALAEGSTLEDAITSSNWGAAVGLSEAIPIAHLIDRVDRGTGGSLKRLIASTLAQGTEEAAQETFQTIMDNLIASDLVGYDPERGTFTGTGDAAGVGFSVGGLMNFIGQIVVGRRAPRAGRPDEAAPSAPRERTADEIIAFAENRINELELEGRDTATQEEADFLRAHLGEPELLAAAYGERLVPGSQPTRAPVQPVSQADIDSPIPTPMIAEGRQVVSESLEAARDGRPPAAQEPTDATTQQAEEQRPEPEVQAQEEALEPRAQAQRTDEQPRPVLAESTAPQARGAVQAAPTAEDFLDEQPTGTFQPARLSEGELVTGEESLAERSRADIAGEQPDRARLIVARNFLSEWMDDYSVPQPIAGRVGDLYRRLDSELAGNSANIPALEAEVATEFRDWLKEVDVDDDVATELRAIGTGIAERIAAPTATSEVASQGAALVPREQLYVERGGQRYPVESFEDAAARWSEFRDETGAGVSEIGSALPIVNQAGETVAHISYNGKVWEGAPEAWTPDTRLLVGERFQAATQAETIADRMERLGETEEQARAAIEGLPIEEAATELQQRNLRRFAEESDARVRDERRGSAVTSPAELAREPQRGAPPAAVAARPKRPGAAPAAPETGVPDRLPAADQAADTEPALAPRPAVSESQPVDPWGETEEIGDKDRIAQVIDNEAYRGALDSMARDLIKGGGVALVPSEELGVTFGGRTPSLNPEWFKAMNEIPEFKMSVAQVRAAVDKALEGKLLGKRQARVVRIMVEQIAEDQRRESLMPTAEELAEEGIDNVDESRAIAELLLRAEKIDEAATEEVLEKADGPDAVREGLDAIIAGAGNQLRRQTVASDTGGQSPQRPPEAGETDLLGDDVRAQQALADETRQRDEARSRGQESVETGDPSDLFSQARQQVDIEDQARAPAQPDTVPRETLRLRERRQQAEGPLTAMGFKRVDANTLAFKTDGENDSELLFNVREHGGEPTQYRVTRSVRFPRTGVTGAPTQTLGDFDSAQAAADAVRAAMPAQPQTDAPISDFGERLEGARKHLFEAYRDRLRDAGDIAEQPLSKSWPEPDYQKLIEEGADPWVVAFIRTARDEIPTKPRKGWKLRQWVEQTTGLRKFARDLLDGTITREKIETALQTDEFKRLGEALTGRMDLYLAVGHEKSLKGVRISAGRYSMLNGEPVDPPRVIWSIERKAKASAFSNWPKQLAQGDTREEAIADFKRRYAEIDTQPRASKQISFQIYSYRTGPKANRWIIGKKIGKDRLDLREFDTPKEARAYLNENQAELEQALERYKNIPDHRKESDAPRVGEDHRNGADITPEVFSETFGFRGVQFGNYVEGGRRQQDLNDAYDALLDLAGVLGVPPKALSLNGELGLAFGARGKGGKRAARAHYEPGTVVINLTKRQGAGSLAHEWWHSVDNYFSRRRGLQGEYLTEVPGRESDEGVRPEVAQAFRTLVQQINQTSLRERSRGLDQRRTKPYWSTGREMSARAFESYIVAKLQDQQQSNDYLANIVSEDYWRAAAALGVGEGSEQQPDYPYPTAAEISTIRAAFDQLFDVIETRETDTGVEMFSLDESANSQTAGDLRVSSRFSQEWQQNRGEVAAELRRELDRIGLRRVTLRLPDSMDVIDGRQQRVGGISGRYKPGLIDVALAPERDYGRTLRHEAIHALKDLGLFRNAEWRALERAAQADTDRMAEVRDRYAPQNLTEDQLIEERVADMYADWSADRTQAGGFVRTAFERIKAFLEALGNALRGNGFQTAADVFERIQTGEVGGRQTRADVETAAATPRFALEAGGFRPEVARRIQRGEAVAAAASQVPPPSEPDPRQAFSDGFSEVPQTVFDFVRQKLQDRFIDLKRVQESTGRVPDEMDAYLGEELYHGRAEAAIEEARETSMKPLLDAIRDADLTIEQAGEYLYARHAKERNRRISEINPLFAEGGGSGMTDAEADAILSRYRGNAAVERIGELVDGITAKHRALLLSSGLEKPEAIEAWERMYERYVPLKGRGDIDDDGRISPSRGRGFDVRGRTKAATGRKSMAQNIVANVLAQYETDIIRSQKSEVGRSLLRFVEAHPDSTLWEVDRVEYAGKVNPRTGLVEYRPDQRYQLADNVLVVKVDGVDHHITFHGERGKRIASSMKNLGAANAGGAIRAFAAVNRVLSAVNTGLNPEFIVSNLARDLQTAGINLSGTEADAVKGRIIWDAKKAWRGIRLAQGSVFASKRDVAKQWARHYETFRRAGGKTGWIDAHNDVNRLQSQLEREIKQYQRNPGDPRKLIRLLGEFVEAENISVENSVRLSAFVHALRLGMSEAKAASLAKNLTVNFNRKGEYGVLMNSLYLFYNASIQGNIRMFQALRSPKVRKIAGGIVVFAAMLDILNRTVGGDDEDDVPLYDKIPPWVKERNIIIMNSMAERGYYHFPLPWGYNIFHVLGQQVGEAASAAMGLKPDYRPVDSALTLLSAIAGAFNPLGSDASIGQFLSPTITDPIVSLEGNRDWAGRPIRPGENPFEQAPTPDSQKFWNSTGEIPRWISERLNALTGGSEVRPGIVDISPTTFDYLFEFATGGAGRFISNTVDAPLKLLVEGEVETYRIPFVRQVYGDIGSRATQDRFYENLEQVYYAEQELELAQENRDIRAQQDIRRTQRVYLGARLRAQSVERRLRQLRQQRNSIRAQDTPESIKRPRLRRIEERMEREMLAFNRYIRQRQQ